MKQYKVERYGDFRQLTRFGIAIDESSVNFSLDLENDYVLKEIIESVSYGFKLGYNSGRIYIERESVSGSLEGAIHNFNYILKQLPNNEKQELAKNILHNITRQFLEIDQVKISGKTKTKFFYDENYLDMFQKVIGEVKTHLASGTKIHLDSVMYGMFDYVLYEEEFKNLLKESDDKVFEFIDTIYPKLKSGIEELSKQKELFEAPGDLMKSLPLYLRLRVAEKEYSSLKAKTEEEKATQRKNVIQLAKDFDAAGGQFPSGLISALVMFHDKEINSICKKHWDSYNGTEDKYRTSMFYDTVSLLVKNKHIMVSQKNGVVSEEEQENTKKLIEQKIIVREFLSSFSKDDIANILKLYKDKKGFINLESRRSSGFILFLAPEKIKEIAGSIKIPLDVLRYAHDMYEDDKNIFLQNLEMLIEKESFVGKFGKEEHNSLVCKYICDLVNNPEKVDDRKRELITKLITKYDFDIKYNLEQEPKLDKAKVAKFLEPFKKDIETAKKDRADTTEIIGKLADELTKAAVGDKFAGKSAREAIQKGIKDNLLKLSEYEDTHPIFKEITTNETKRKELVEKFAKTIDKEAIKNAKDMKGLVSAVMERLWNIIGLVFGFEKENLGQLMKGRVTGFEAPVGFVEKLKKEANSQGEGPARQ